MSAESSAELFPDPDQIRTHWNAITRPGDVLEVRDVRTRGEASDLISAAVAQGAA